MRDLAQHGNSEELLQNRGVCNDRRAIPGWFRMVDNHSGAVKAFGDDGIDSELGVVEHTEAV